MLSLKSKTHKQVFEVTHVLHYSMHKSDQKAHSHKDPDSKKISLKKHDRTQKKRPDLIKVLCQIGIQDHPAAIQSFTTSC